MRTLLRLLRVGLPLAIVAAFITKADIRLLAQSITVEVGWAMVMAMPLFFIANVPLMWRLGWLVAPPSVSFRHSSVAFILATGLNAVLPLHLSQVLKATYLREHCAVALTRTFAAIAVERLADLTTLSVIAVLFASALLARFTAIESVWLLGGLALVSVALMAFAGRYSHIFVRFLPNEHLRSFVTDFLGHVEEMVLTWRFWVSILIGAVAMAVSVVTYWALIALVGSIPLSLIDTLGLFLVVVAFAAALPSLPGGFGVYEAAVIMVLREHGYGLEEAAVLALALHVSQILLMFCVSMLLLVREKTGLSSLRKKLMGAFSREPVDALD